MKLLIAAIAVVMAFSASSAFAYTAATVDEQRAEIQKMQSATLNRLYKAAPGTAEKVAKAEGTAVFTNADLAVIFFSGSYGHGISHDNRTGTDTYMKMASAGVGLGLGAKDFRVVFIFHDRKIFDDFVKRGLDLSGHADLAAKQGASGGATGGAVDVLPGVEIYQMTKSGLLAQVMLKGTKYWNDTELNGIPPTAPEHNEFNQ